MKTPPKRRFVVIQGWRRDGTPERDLRHPTQTYKHNHPPFIRLYCSLFDPRFRPRGFDHLTDAERFQYLAVLVAYAQNDGCLEADPKSIQRQTSLESPPPLEKFAGFGLIELLDDDGEVADGDPYSTHEEGFESTESQRSEYRDQSTEIISHTSPLQGKNSISLLSETLDSASLCSGVLTDPHVSPIRARPTKDNRAGQATRGRGDSTRTLDHASLVKEIRAEMRKRERDTGIDQDGELAAWYWNKYKAESLDLMTDSQLEETLRFIRDGGQF